MKWAVVVAIACMAMGIGLKSANASGSAPNQMPPWPWSGRGFAAESVQFTPVAYPVKTVKDNMLPQGQTLLLQPGRPGIVFQVGPVRASITAPTQQIVAQGTAPVHTIVINGVTYHYDRVFSVLTTAYNGQYSMNGPSGAVAAWDGLPLHQGDVAVDPNVIPLGTYLYIDGYGPARAVDTGSAIIGDHIDLFFPEPASQIARYGIQFHTVYILTQRPSSYPG